MIGLLKKSISLCGAIFAVISFGSLSAWEIPQVPSWNKIDVAPAYIHMDVLEHGKTVHRVDMPAGRVDSSFIFCGGWTIKPAFMYGQGDNGKFFTLGSGFGYTFPLSECWVITPQVGVSYSHFRTRYDLHTEAFGTFPGIKRTYKTVSPFIGVDSVYNICKGFRVGVTLQYAWANTRTTVGQFFHNDRSRGEGFAAALSIEKDLTENLSIDIGAGYNNSMTKEKHGLRGYGAKAGISYWF